jgi:electron transfer flavoprotein alpha subunit
MSANEILVCSEKTGVLCEMLAKAREKADALSWTVSALLLAKEGFDAASFAAAGADVIYQIDTDLLPVGDGEAGTTFVSGVINQVQPTLILMGATKYGMEVAPRAAERVQGAYVASAVDFDIDASTHAVTARCTLYTGLGLGTVQLKPRTTILTVAPGTFEASTAAERSARIEPVVVSAGQSRLQIVEYKPKAVSGARVEEAKAIVDVGQGVKQKEDLQMIHTLADQLGGLVTCTRPVSSDRDWFPEWLGLSGKKVSPELCVMIGVSGAVQHIVGVRDSRVTVAVNNDENAGVFLESDYGVVADLYLFVPALLDRLKARGIHPDWMS